MRGNRMTDASRNLVEVCIYEVKPDKTVEFEKLVTRVKEHHNKFPGVTDVRYIKRTHRQGDLASVIRGERPTILARKQKSVTYVLYWEMEDDITLSKVAQSSIKEFHSDFMRFLIRAPKVILGKRLV
jgi:hypothetical protein